MLDLFLSVVYMFMQERIGFEPLMDTSGCFLGIVLGPEQVKNHINFRRILSPACVHI